MVRALGGVAIDSKGAVGRRTRPVGEPVVVQVDRGGQSLAITAIPTAARRGRNEEEQIPDLPSANRPEHVPVRSLAGDLASQIETVLGGHGRAPKWSAVTEGGRTVIRQEEADKTGIRFPMAIVRGFVAGTSSRGQVPIRRRSRRPRRRHRHPLAGSGELHRRRANAAEAADLRIFRVANGVRKTLPGAAS